jgi:hypothetical protein
MRSSTHALFLSTCALFLPAFLAGCGTSSVSANPGESTHGSGPVPTVTEQAVQVDGVAPNRSQEVQFSEPMDPATINSRTFILTDPDGNRVPGSVSYDSTFDVGIFQPSPALQTGATYKATIATGAASTGGRHLAEPYTYSFATRTSADNSPIAINQVSPAANAACVSPTAQIVITFDEAPDAATVTSRNIVVTDSSGNTIATKLSTNIDTTQVVVTPVSPLPSGVITVRVSNIGDLADRMLQQPYTWSFSTACGVGGGGTAALQVVYVLNGATLTTWDVDPRTLQASQAGSIAVPAGTYPDVFISPDDHTLYYVTYQDPQLDGGKIRVYPTNSAGVPQSAPVQQVDSSQVNGQHMDPSGTLVYAVLTGATTGSSGNQTTPYQLVSYQRNPATGQLGNPTVQATYNLQSDIGGLYCTLQILGFSTHGSELYDSVSCSAPYASSSATDNERTVNPVTGALGPDRAIYRWSNSNGGSENLRFAANLMFDFAFPNPSIASPNYIDVFRIMPNATTPLIHCTASMQSICASYTETGQVDPSGRYLFLNDSSLVTHILRVSTSTGRLDPTGSTIPFQVGLLSPDGSIVYARSYTNNGISLRIYGFNPSNASITSGGSIFVPNSAEQERAAERP